ncbi:MAG TPA: gluconate 2-dehydrogenase subunit 3 family protein [Gemmatimonadaceae bacterium]|nr:gluconate 2-dehydrogenase subunit 3 family protein [Gemmatimonadaceae bacterium]
MTMEKDSIDRREAVRRVTALLGGIAFVGGSRLLSATEYDAHARAALVAESARGVGPFTAADVALLNEVAETMLPATSTPGAKAAKVGPFMALMVNDTYDASEQKIFRDGMKTIDEESRTAYGVGYMKARPRQRLMLLEKLDREQKKYMDAREAAQRARGTGDKKAEAYVPDQRKEMAPATGANPAAAITADSPTHYFRMMKELALLGYFTSEIGYTQAQRYVESPGKFEPCVPYKRGERAWAPHA